MGDPDRENSIPYGQVTLVLIAYVLAECNHLLNITFLVLRDFEAENRANSYM